ncbi:hypothetical protein HRW11_27000 [Streptomyces lunaelactis]|uniref:hypothetical protein n=1 Tax=Streptomyces lunaelactis TaxID=1535768 RepID=UPI0015845213|nr:hypothetical protein [Streptomyces lunaelactis]NUK67661.1 hypothetical protein [Streptomyces lunaelactis]
MTDHHQRPPSPAASFSGPAGFLVLLVVLFAVAYAVGSAAGPVAPGMHPGRTGPTVPTGGDGGPEDGTEDGRGGMGDDMHSMTFTQRSAGGGR